MNNKFIWFFVSPLLFLSGCVYWSNDRAIKIIESNSEMVSSCRLLGEVYGSSIVPFATMGHAIAKDEAKLEAARIGATHIFWHDINSNIPQYALGRAYRCGESLPVAHLEPQ